MIRTPYILLHVGVKSHRFLRSDSPGLGTSGSRSPWSGGWRLEALEAPHISYYRYGRKVPQTPLLHLRCFVEVIRSAIHIFRSYRKQIVPNTILVYMINYGCRVSPRKKFQPSRNQKNGQKRRHAAMRAASRRHTSARGAARCRVKNRQAVPRRAGV